MKSKEDSVRVMKGVLSAALLALAGLVFARPAAALEISLEENRAERGNIGFVDIRRVFRLFPETARAKQSYAEIVRQAEDQVNLRRGELLSLRGELAGLRAEREKAAQTPLPELPALPEEPPTPPAPSPAGAAGDIDHEVLSPGSADQRPPAPAVVPDEGEAAERAASSDTVKALDPASEELKNLPGMGAKAGAAPAPETDKEPLVINIPGVSEEPIVVQQGQSPPPAEDPFREARAAYEKAVHEREEALKAQSEAALTKSQRLKELDAAIAMTEQKAGALERSLREHQTSVEKNLVDIESRRSEILLGKIYQAIRDVAREGGVSVVVDKAQILYGQPSVDMTDKVIRKLEGL